MTAAEWEHERARLVRRLARGLDLPVSIVSPCADGYERHGWWPLRRFLLPRKYRCVFCNRTTRRPWRR